MAAWRPPLVPRTRAILAERPQVLVLRQLAAVDGGSDAMPEHCIGIALALYSGHVLSDVTAGQVR